MSENKNSYTFSVFSCDEGAATGTEAMVGIIAGGAACTGMHLNVFGVIPMHFFTV